METTEFSQRLLELRKKAGLSQEELAGLVNVTRQAVQKWEAGTSRPDMDNLVALANYFSVTLDWLVMGQGAKEPVPPEAVVKERVPTRIILGAVFLGCGLLAGLFLFLAFADVIGLLLPLPLVLAGIVCLAVKRNTALVCGWAVWLPVYVYFRYATGIRLWWALMPWFYDPKSMLSGGHYLIAWGVEWLPLLILLFFTTRAVMRWRKHKKA